MVIPAGWLILQAGRGTLPEDFKPSALHKDARSMVNGCQFFVSWPIVDIHCLEFRLRLDQCVGVWWICMVVTGY